MTLSSLYLDIIKDRLYCDGADSAARRSAQSALWHITQTLAKLMAPILTFTAEEVWQVFGGTGASIMLETWQALPALSAEAPLLDKWNKIRGYRADVMRALEEVRSAGQIGSSLQAGVTLYADGEKFALLDSLGDDLRFVLISSKAQLVRSSEEKVECESLPYTKCERCWHYHPTVGENAEAPTLCARCYDNIFGQGESRSYA